MTTQLVKDEIKAFLTTKKAEVLCIRGKWGTGKTYMWNDILKTNKADIFPPSYAYVSLFGLTSLAQVKTHVYQTTVEAKYIGEDFSIDNVSALKNEGIKAAKKIAEGVGSYLGLGEQLGNVMGAVGLTTSNQIVCIDDLERIGGDLTVADVLGYATFLSKERKCKVVILLNDEALEGDNKARFESYLEKVVDTNLRFSPTPAESAAIAIEATDTTSEIVKANCIALGIDNVRVIWKIYRAAQQVEPMLKDFDPGVLKDVLASLVLFGWCTHQPELAPSMEFLRSYSSRVWGARSEEKFTDAELEWKKILDDYPFNSIDDFDEELIKGVSRGYFAPDAVANHAAELDNRIDAKNAMDEMSAAWDSFRYSFKTTAAEVIDAIIDTHKKNATHLTADNMVGAYGLAKRYGEDAKAKDLLDFFVDANRDNPGVFDTSHLHYHGEDFPPEVQEALRAAYEVTHPPLSLDELLISLSSQYSSDTIEALDKHSSKEIEAILLAHEGDELRKRGVGITDLFRIGNPSPAILSVRAKTTEALKHIAKMSAINDERVRRTWRINTAEPVAPEEAEAQPEQPVE